MTGPVRPSVRPSGCLSVRHTFLQCCCHRIIMSFPGTITLDTRKVHAKDQGHIGHDPT